MRLPDFVIIGAAKCGTTSLHRYLDQHPGIFMAQRREPSFFAHEGQRLEFTGPGDDEWKFVTDLTTYESLFVDAEPHLQVGEVSPRYLFFPRSSARLKHYIPEVRLIVILRHPVDRAYSHFLMNRARNCEPEGDFVCAIEKEAERAISGWGWDWQYVAAGRYAEQLVRYYRLFSSGQIKVFLYSELAMRPAAFFRELFEFIGVDPDFYPDTSTRDRVACHPRNKVIRNFLREPSGFKTSLKRVLPLSFARNIKRKAAAWNSVRRTPLSDAVREELFMRYFADDSDRLEQLIERDLSDWKSTRLA